MTPFLFAVRLIQVIRFCMLESSRFPVITILLEESQFLSPLQICYGMEYRVVELEQKKRGLLRT